VALRVGINGFGRIGRILFRAGYGKLDIAGINNIGTIPQLAHMLKYDSTHGIFPHEVSFDEKHLIVDGNKIPVSTTKNPADIPWKQWEVDLVFECTGVFKEKEDLEKHFTAGAKRVFVSGPAAGVELNVVYGVNHELYNPSEHKIVGNASCTTNCLAPMAKVLNDEFGIEHGFMTTVHSYTNDQNILDAPHSDLRRARAAAVSMIPTTTGAAKMVGKILPELKGRIDGTAIRVPTPNVSLVDLVFTSARSLTVESVNQALVAASKGSLKGILACELAPLVSVDFNGNPHSSTIDLPSTMVLGDKMAKVLSWYDNETGFSNRMVDVALYMADRGI
jgi:glyceraldehyde 3-phosphate dehydrogenase